MPGCPGYVDSLDPCDPTSTAYDYATCANMEAGGGNPCDPTGGAYDPYLCSQGGYNPPGGPVDSGDPCDPASVQYNPQVCSELQGAAGGGGGDPCDPNNPYYDPNACAQFP